MPPSSRRCLIAGFIGWIGDSLSRPGGFSSEMYVRFQVQRGGYGNLLVLGIIFCIGVL